MSALPCILVITSKDRLMIENDDQLKQANSQIGLMQEALADLKRRVLPVNLRNFCLLAEGPLDEIRKLQNEIDEYCGVKEAKQYKKEAKQVKKELRHSG